MSGMCNRACLFPITTKKNTILFCLLLCPISTLHEPNCVIVVQLYVFSGIFVVLVVTNCSFSALGNNFLYICNGIMYLSLPVSTLCHPVILTWFYDIIKFLLLPNDCY